MIFFVGIRIGHSPQVPAMFRTLLLLLYGSGMRISEALHLTLKDVDLTEQVKFFKTRLVPIGPKLTRELADHIERRHHSRRVTVEVGVIRVSSHCFSTSVELPESIAPSASSDLHAYTTFATRRLCIG